MYPHGCVHNVRCNDSTCRLRHTIHNRRLNPPAHTPRHGVESALEAPGRQCWFTDEPPQVRASSPRRRLCLPFASDHHRRKLSRMKCPYWGMGWLAGAKRVSMPSKSANFHRLSRLPGTGSKPCFAGVQERPTALSGRVRCLTECAVVLDGGQQASRESRSLEGCEQWSEERTRGADAHLAGALQPHARKCHESSAPRRTIPQ